LLKQGVFPLTISPDVIPSLGQYGVAGLMEALWFLERRHSSQRERELTEAHALLVREREELSELIGVVKENSAAMTALKQSQSRLSRVCEEIVVHLRSGGRSVPQESADRPEL